MSHYMTRDERQKLEALHRARVPVAKIAAQLGFCRQTIYNELKLGSYDHEKNGFLVKRYSADKTQQIHEYNQTAKGRPLKIEHDHAYANFLENKIVNERYSPATALASAERSGFQTRICTATLYSYIEKRVFLRLTMRHLWEKSKKPTTHKEKVQRIAHPALPCITARPEAINQRLESGHWELDLIIGKKRTNAVLMTLTERRSRRELIFKLPNKKASSVRAVFDRLERQDPKFKEHFRSITTDNGPEFLEYDLLVKSIHGGTRFDVYYCHSYSAWEKGTNENHNRMIRRWFPKGTDFTKVTKKRIAEVQAWMNGYPRKILGWQTPDEAAA